VSLGAPTESVEARPEQRRAKEAEEANAAEDRLGRRDVCLGDHPIDHRCARESAREKARQRDVWSSERRGGGRRGQARRGEARRGEARQGEVK